MAAEEDEAARQKRLEYSRRWYQANRDKQLAYQKQRRIENGDQMRAAARERQRKNMDAAVQKNREYRERNREKVSAYHASYHQRHREKRVNRERERWQGYYEANRREVIERSRARNLARANRVPPWADLDHIRDFYELARIATECTGFEFHVDHTIPLRGKRVSGLHVPLNLSVVLAEHNLSKGNKWHS